MQSWGWTPQCFRVSAPPDSAHAVWQELRAGRVLMHSNSSSCRLQASWPTPDSAQKLAVSGCLSEHNQVERFSSIREAALMRQNARVMPVTPEAVDL